MTTTILDTEQPEQIAETTSTLPTVFISKFALIPNVGVFEARVRYQPNYVGGIFADPCNTADIPSNLPSDYANTYYRIGEYHATYDEAVDAATKMRDTALAQAENEVIRLRGLSFKKQS